MRKVTFEIDEVYVEMIDDYKKRSEPADLSRSAVVRLAVHMFMSSMGYTLTEHMDSSELQSLRLKEGEEFPKWIRQDRVPGGYWRCSKCKKTSKVGEGSHLNEYKDDVCNNCGAILYKNPMNKTER